MANHNLRTRLTVGDKARIDPKRHQLNRVLENPLKIDTSKGPDMLAKFKKHWADNDIAIKKDSVLVVDMVLTTSPEYWGDDWNVNGRLTPATQKKLDEWMQVQMDFVKKHFGPDAVKFAVLHLDEKTPHIHVMLSPEETKVLKYKNQYGTQEKEIKSLNAKRWNPTFWKKFVTAYAKVNEKFGLKRPTEDAMTEKITLKEYDKLIHEAATEDYSKVIGNMVDDVLAELGVLSSRQAVKKALDEKLVPRLKILAKSNKAVKSLLEIDRGLEYRLLKKLKKETEEQLAEANRKIEYHGNKIKTIDELKVIISNKDRKIVALRAEVEKFKPKLAIPSPTAIPPRKQGGMHLRPNNA